MDGGDDRYPAGRGWICGWRCSCDTLQAHASGDIYMWIPSYVLLLPDFIFVSACVFSPAHVAGPAGPRRPGYGMNAYMQTNLQARGICQAPRRVRAPAHCDCRCSTSASRPLHSHRCMCTCLDLRRCLWQCTGAWQGQRGEGKADMAGVRPSAGGGATTAVWPQLVAPIRAGRREFATG